MLPGRPPTPVPGPDPAARERESNTVGGRSLARTGVRRGGGAAGSGVGLVGDAPVAAGDGGAAAVGPRPGVGGVVVAPGAGSADPGGLGGVAVGAAGAVGAVGGGVLPPVTVEAAPPQQAVGSGVDLIGGDAAVVVGVEFGGDGGVGGSEGA